MAHQPRRRKRAESGPVGTTRHGYARSSRPSSRRRLRGGRHHCWSFHGSRVDRGVPGHGAEAGRPRGDGAIAMPNVGDAPHERRARCGKCPLIGTQGGPHHGHAWPARGDTHCGDTAGRGCERMLSLFDLTPITRRGQPHWYTQATPRQMRAHINTSHTHTHLYTHTSPCTHNMVFSVRIDRKMRRECAVGHPVSAGLMGRRRLAAGRCACVACV